MKKIDILKNLYKGQDIYVIASEKSVDYVDKHFFDNKIAIGVNNIYKRFPNLTYYLCKENSVAKEYSVNKLNFVCSEFDCGNPNKVKNRFKNGYFYKHDENKESEIIDVFDRNNYLTVSWSTITSAIHFAYHLGACNIILVGHDCGTLDNQTNIDSYTGHKFSNNEYIDWLSKIESQTLWLKKKINNLGVNIYSLNPFINFGLEGHIYQR